jgi:hypothetical protein
MRIQPRQQLLEIWRAVMRASYRDDSWQWGGRDGTNSISDAEQLLCLLLPAAHLDVFNLDRPDETADDVIAALKPLGGAVDIPRVLIDILTDYFTRYVDESGTPLFSGSTYFEAEDGEPTDDQRGLDIVDSFAMSVTLSLAAIGFVRVFRRVVTKDKLRQKIDSLEELARVRLSAAMVGLLRSFTVNVFEVDSPEGRALCTTVNQTGLPTRTVVQRLRRELRETRASFNQVLIGSGQPKDLDREDRLFECGWSWGIVQDAPEIDTAEKVGAQREGVAEDKPYLYFTVIALDAIEDLFSERTRLLQLLTDEQQRLSQALQLRWQLTRSYWATVATFSTGERWPLQDVPWRATDADASDYYTLQVTSLAVKGLVRTRGTDAELSRVGKVLGELAERARITRRPETEDDPKIALHQPGKQLKLNGSEQLGDARLVWTVSEFAALLLQRLSLIAGLLSDSEQRSRLLDLADRVWDHLLKRRLQSGPARYLWDQPAGAFGRASPSFETPSWYYTERVVQALVTTASVISQPPLRSEPLAAYGRELLNEAEHLFDKELLTGAAAAGPTIQRSLREIQVTLQRARELLPARPGTAAVLAADVLRGLDEFAAARLDVTEGI